MYINGINWDAITELIKPWHPSVGDEFTITFCKEQVIKMERTPRDWMYIHEYLGITEDECDNRIEAWHEATGWDIALELHEYLGIPWEDFKHLR